MLDVRLGPRAQPNITRQIDNLQIDNQNWQIDNLQIDTQQKTFIS